MSDYPIGKPLLTVEGLRKYFVQRSGLFKQHKRHLHAVDGVGFEIRRGEILGLVGESGCGKSTLGKTLLRLYEPDAGRIEFDGVDLCTLPREALRQMRKRMQMIFQDPYDSLNSRHTVGAIVEEPLIVHGIGTPAERRTMVLELLERVGLPADGVDRYPHEFSGGQRQRIGIARAIALRPEFIVCDEPLSALDISVQAQIINLLLELRASLDLSLLFISHDLAVVRHMSDRVAVMYLGEIVELASAASIYSEARHPYTQYLVASIPQAVRGVRRERNADGEVPSPLNPPSGCRFHPRCPLAQDICSVEAPRLEAIASDAAHRVACHFARS